MIRSLVVAVCLAVLPTANARMAHASHRVVHPKTSRAHKQKTPKVKKSRKHKVTFWV